MQTVQNAPKTQEEKDKVLMLFTEKLLTAISESNELFAELDLYGTLEIAGKCGEFSYKYAFYTNEQFDEMNKDLSEIELLMRNDLESYR